MPSATFEEVEARFVAGSGIHGADIRAMIQRITWGQQLEKFAEIVLTNAFSIYEGWAGEVVERSNAAKFKDNDLSFWGNGAGKGAMAFIGHINAQPSIVMEKAFKPHYITNRKYHPAQLDSMFKSRS